MAKEKQKRVYYGWTKTFFNVYPPRQTLMVEHQRLYRSFAIPFGALVTGNNAN